jgi:hypothetical protein
VVHELLLRADERHPRAPLAGQRPLEPGPDLLGRVAQRPCAIQRGREQLRQRFAPERHLDPGGLAQIRDHDSLARMAHHQVLGRQGVVRVTDGDRRHSQVRGELTDRRQGHAGLEAAEGDLVDDLVPDLEVDRQPARPVDCEHSRSPCT